MLLTSYKETHLNPCFSTASLNRSSSVQSQGPFVVDVLILIHRFRQSLFERPGIFSANAFQFDEYPERANQERFVNIVILDMLQIHLH